VSRNNASLVVLYCHVVVHVQNRKDSGSGHVESPIHVPHRTPEATSNRSAFKMHQETIVVLHGNVVVNVQIGNPADPATSSRQYMSHIARRKLQVIGLNSGDCVKKRRNPCCAPRSSRRTCPNRKSVGSGHVQSPIHVPHRKPEASSNVTRFWRLRHETTHPLLCSTATSSYMSKSEAQRIRPCRVAGTCPTSHAGSLK